ncbi:hypothetical protein H0H81_009206 [Sphagnurus paluster]|uniref:F-box domain-containing protein n=1 Tax=Sphagnurus paluster TaxID=117069 RepID=A0A9P7GK84_9AGAR|nr:hypothetical protein H0H81_009206 [Sphagnurus paluster]
MNSTGFPTLPTELLVEIISYFPSLPVPAKYQDLREEYRERAQTLHALTRLCRSLRRVFLPIMWERVEVLLKLRTDGKDTFFTSWKRPLAIELVRQLEIVTVRDSTLATYVKTVNVVLTNYSCKNVMQEFVRCLPLFPNLATLQIVGVPEKHAPCFLDLSDAISHEKLPKLPSMRTAVLPGYATELLRYCDNLRFVASSSRIQFFFKMNISPHLAQFRALYGSSSSPEVQGRICEEPIPGNTHTKPAKTRKVLVLKGASPITWSAFVFATRTTRL